MLWNFLLEQTSPPATERRAPVVPVCEEAASGQHVSRRSACLSTRLRGAMSGWASGRSASAPVSDNFLFMFWKLQIPQKILLYIF